MKKLSDKYYVAGQISPTEMPNFAEAGIGIIINNRPDGESDMQTPGDVIMATAQSQNMNYFAIPVAGGIGPEQVHALRKILDNAGEPVLAYCASGTRSTILWALSQAGTMETDEIIATAAEAGYDLNPYRQMIVTVAQASTPPSESE